MSNLPSNAKQVFHGEIVDVYQWPQTMFDGSMRTFECITRPDTAAVIPFLDPSTVLLTHQEQPGRELFWDIPGGRVDPGEDMQTAVLRELWEETGYHAKRLIPWNIKQHGGMARFGQGIFLAIDLELDPSYKKFDHEDGEKIELHKVSWDELVQRCLRRELRQPDVMLNILCMEYNPEDKQKLHTFLNQTK